MPETLLDMNSPDRGIIVATVTHAAEIPLDGGRKQFSVEMHGEGIYKHVVVDFLYDNATDRSGLPHEGDRYAISYKRISP